MFLDSGDGMVFKGNVGPWWNPKSGEFHLSEQDAYEIISQSLESYYSKFGNYPKEIFIHAKTYFDDVEWKGFEEAVQGKSQIIGVRIRAMVHLSFTEVSHIVYHGERCCNMMIRRLYCGQKGLFQDLRHKWDWKRLIRLTLQ